MNISLDYDNTYTTDPVMWDAIVNMMKRHGHKVYVVTMRTPEEGYEVTQYLGDKVEDIIFTSRKGKMDFVQAKNISIDIWIDDMPWFILNDARQL